VALLPPLFQQNRTYSARVTRQFVELIGTEGVIGPTALAVSQRSAGAAMSVDVAAGKAFVAGDDQANQGTYLIVNEATVELPITPADPSNSRIDAVILQVRDPNAGGPAGDDVIVTVLTGTPAASPVPPSVPASAILLASVVVPAAATSITDSDITDERTFAAAGLAGALGNLNDVQLTDPLVADQFFQYDGAAWRNATVSLPLDSFFLMGA